MRGSRICALSHLPPIYFVVNKMFTKINLCSLIFDYEYFSTKFLIFNIKLLEIINLVLCSAPLISRLQNKRGTGVQFSLLILSAEGRRQVFQFTCEYRIPVSLTLIGPENQERLREGK